MPSDTSGTLPLLPAHKMDCGMKQLLSSLSDVTQQRNSCKDLDYAFLKNVLESPDIQNLLKVHQKVRTPEEPDVRTATSTSSESRKDLVEDLEICSYGKERKELLELLSNPHVKCLLEAHDQIAAKDFLPCLPDIAHEVDEDDGICVKVVTLVKGDVEPLGATIQMQEGDNTSVRVARVMHGGAADRAGNFRGPPELQLPNVTGPLQMLPVCVFHGVFEVGDEVKSVNGLSLEGKSPTDVLHMLSKTTGTISLRLGTGEKDRGTTDTSKVKVRACFQYSPYEDPYSPCPEAGLAFLKGEVLHIVSQQDAWWWQARKDGETAARAGLIPSKMLAQKLKGHLNSKENKENRILSDEKNNRFSPRLMKKSKKPKKYLENEFNSTPEGSNQPKSEIRSHRQRYVTAQELEKYIREKRILEHEEKGGYFFALTDEEIKSLIHSGKTCIMCCKPETIPALRRGDIKPYTILVKPQPQDKSRLSGIPRRVSKDSDMSKALEECARIEEQYAPLLDTCLVYSKNTETLIKDIVAIAQNIRTNPSWVPASWTR